MHREGADDEGPEDDVQDRQLRPRLVRRAALADGGATRRLQPLHQGA
jgi:hypothetical protein